MNALFTAALALVALVTFGLRPATADARTGRQMLAAARTAGWGQRAWWLLNTLVEVPLLVVYAAARTGLYFAALALTWTACQAANALAMDDRPIRLVRLPRPEVVCA